MSGTALGELRGTRVRPTYAIVCNAHWRAKSSYPKSSCRQLAPGATVHWKLFPWRGVADQGEVVQTRWVQSAVFKESELACTFSVRQTRIPVSYADDECVPDTRYIDVCDEASQQLYDHAESVAEAIAHLEDREVLLPGETMAELDDLCVEKKFLNTQLWAPAMLTVLKRLARSTEYGELLCLLNAKPLELVWRENALDRSPQLIPQERSPQEEQLAKRRHAALLRLYEKRLGFEPVSGTLMAAWVRTY